MKLSIDLGRWTTTKAALAVAGVLMIGGAVGTALAISPTVSPPIKWQGGWERVDLHSAPGTTVVEVAVVPAGRNLLMTDIVVSTNQSSDVYFSVFEGGTNCSTQLAYRLAGVLIPPRGTLHFPLETGIGFRAGTRICASAGSFADFNFRGFLFTPS